ncbi:MAG: AsmA family protein [Rickettsiales bacterium]
MKAALYIIGFILSLVLAGAIIAPYVLDIDRHKPRLTKIIEEKTGYGVKLNGKAKAVFFPTLSLTLDDAEIYSSPDYQDKIAAVRTLKLNMNAFKAIGGKIIVDELTLDSPQLWIKKNKDGLHNFEKPAKPKEDPKNADTTTFLGILKLIVKDGKGEYTADGKRYVLDGVNLEAGYRPTQDDNRFDLKIASLTGAGITEKQLRLAADYGYKDERLQLSDLILEARGHRFTGEGAITVGQKTTVGTLALETKDIDVAGLLGVKAPSSAPDAGAAPKASAGKDGWSAAPLNLTPLRDMDLAISLKAESLAYGDATLRPFVARAALKPNGAVTVATEKARFAEGDVAFSAAASPLKGAASEISLTFGAKDISTAALPAAIIAKGAPMSGKASADANLSMRGASVREFVSTLGGKASATIRDGKIRSNRLFDAFVAGKAALEGAQPAPKQDAYIVLSSFSADFTGASGIFSTSNLQASTDKLNVEGKGDLDVYNTRIDMLFTGQPTKSADASRVLSAVPVRVVGDFSHPKILLDLNTGIKRILENPENFKDAVKGLKEGFGEDIKGLKNQLERAFDKKPSKNAPQKDDGAKEKDNGLGGLGGILQQLGQ